MVQIHGGLCAYFNSAMEDILLSSANVSSHGDSILKTSVSEFYMKPCRLNTQIM